MRRLAGDATGEAGSGYSTYLSRNLRLVRECPGITASGLPEGTTEKWNSAEFGSETHHPRLGREQRRRSGCAGQGWRRLYTSATSGLDTCGGARLRVRAVALPLFPRQPSQRSYRLTVVAAHTESRQPAPARLCDSPLLAQVGDWFKKTYVALGAEMQMGMKLPRVFEQAGLPVPEARVESRLVTDPGSPYYHLIPEFFRTLLPTMERLGWLRQQK